MKKYFLFLLLIFHGCSPEKKIENPIAEKQIEEETPATIQTLLKLHNEQRELKGRTGFELDSYLSDYAQKHSDWMAQKNTLRHSSINVLMGKYFFVGENIAWNQKTELEVVDAWMHSSGHRANIMNRSYTKIGFGMSLNEKGELYWCTVFGG